MATASPYITISVMYLTAKMASSIGPNLEAVLNAGPALILQEFGNLGTIFLALPIAVCVFKMGRAAVGASFSTSREGSIAIVGNLYGCLLYTSAVGRAGLLVAQGVAGNDHSVPVSYTHLIQFPHDRHVDLRFPAL